MTRFTIDDCMDRLTQEKALNDAKARVHALIAHRTPESAKQILRRARLRAFELTHPDTNWDNVFDIDDHRRVPFKTSRS